MGETGRHGGAFFFGVTEEDREVFDGGHGDVSAVVSGQKGLFRLVSGQGNCGGIYLTSGGRTPTYLALEVQEKEGGGHRGRLRRPAVRRGGTRREDRSGESRWVSIVWQQRGRAGRDWIGTGEANETH